MKRGINGMCSQLCPCFPRRPFRYLDFLAVGFPQPDSQKTKLKKMIILELLPVESYVCVLQDLAGDDEDPVVAVSWGSVSLRCCWDGWTRGR